MTDAKPALGRFLLFNSALRTDRPCLKFIEPKQNGAIITI